MPDRPRQPRVYVVHLPMWHDRTLNAWRSKLDISQAESFGDIVHLLRPQSAANYALDYAATVAELRRGLSDFRSCDYLLPVGHPVLIGAATAIAASRAEGRLNMLEWNRDDDGFYKAVQLNLWGEMPAFT